MKTKITIFYNPETDDLYAAILSKPYKDKSKLELQSYSKIGQHCLLSIDYIGDSLNATINEDSFNLYKELKTIYKDADFIEQYKFRDILEELK